MLRVLIADDEPSTRTTLATCIDWAALGFSLVEQARNGQEALETAQQFKPDLMICDVRMPRMNGTDLAKAVRQKLPDCGIIFLSGYSDREYLKTAIQVQAAAYLDKPLDLEQIRAAVEDVVRRIGERSLLDEASGFRRQNRCQEVLRISSVPSGQTGTSAAPPPGTEAWPPNLGAPLRFPLVLALIRLKGDRNGMLDGNGQGLVAAVGGLNGQSGADQICACPAPGGQIFLVLEGASSTQAARECLDILIARHCPEGMELHCAALGDPAETPDDLGRALHQAELRIQRSFYETGTNCFCKDPPSGSVFLPGKVFWDGLRNAARQGNAQDLADLAEELGRLAWAARDPDLTGVRRNFGAALGILQEELGRSAPDLAEELLAAPDLAASTRLLRQAAQTLLAGRGERSVLDTKLARIRQFIHQDYPNPDLSVEILAEQEHISVPYLCTSFKKLYGSTIKDYLTDYRISQAQKSLRSSDDKLQAIALQVGFRDVNYFSTLFKRITGVPPREYRQIHHD